MHHRVRISQTLRRALLRTYLDLGNEMVIHFKACAICQKDDSCAQWDSLYVEFRIAESKSRLLGLITPEASPWI